MDAKKAEKYIKRVYYKDTKANRTSTIAGIIGGCIYVAMIYFTAKIVLRKYPETRQPDNFITRYFNSEDYKIHLARLKGYLPPDRSLSEKYNRKTVDNPDRIGPNY